MIPPLAFLLTNIHQEFPIPAVADGCYPSLFTHAGRTAAYRTGWNTCQKPITDLGKALESGKASNTVHPVLCALLVPRSLQLSTLTVLIAHGLVNLFRLVRAFVVAHCATSSRAAIALMRTSIRRTMISSSAASSVFVSS